MISIGDRMRVLLSLVLVIDLMLFSSMTGLTIIAMVVGAIAIILGMGYSYKPAAVIGLLIVSITAAAAMELSTLLETSTFISGIFGLLVPVVFLSWLVLSAEEETSANISIAREPTIASLIFAVLCVASVPLIMFVMNLLVPTITMRVTASVEIAVLAIVTIVGGVYLTRTRPSNAPGREAGNQSA